MCLIGRENNLEENLNIKSFKIKSYERGLSILELAFSVSIIGLVIIFIIGMYSTFFTSGTKLNEETVANFIAQAYINLYTVYANSEDVNLRDRVRRLVIQDNTLRQESQFGLYTSQFVGRRNYVIQIVGRNIYTGDVSDSILVNVGVYWFQEQGGIRRGYGRTGVVMRKALNVPK